MKRIIFNRNQGQRTKAKTRLYNPGAVRRTLVIEEQDTAAAVEETEETSAKRGPRLGLRETPTVIGENKPGMTLGERIGLTVCIFALSGMLLFVLSGYERISLAYSEINTLNTEIDKLKIRINALEAELECAVTIESAQQYASTHGMQYPNKSQYYRVGDPLPASAGIAPAQGADGQSLITGSDPTAGN